LKNSLTILVPPPLRRNVIVLRVTRVARQVELSQTVGLESDELQVRRAIFSPVFLRVSQSDGRVEISVLQRGPERDGFVCLDRSPSSKPRRSEIS